MNDKVKAAKDIATSVLAGLTTFGVATLDSDAQVAVVGIVGYAVTLAVTFFGGGNKA